MTQRKLALAELTHLVVYFKVCDGSDDLESVTGHRLHCPACNVHLTSLFGCPGCGERYVSMTSKTWEREARAAVAEAVAQEREERERLMVAHVKACDEYDYCWVCDCHPGQDHTGHAKNCPLLRGASGEAQEKRR